MDYIYLFNFRLYLVRMRGIDRVFRVEEAPSVIGRKFTLVGPCALVFVEGDTIDIALSALGKREIKLPLNKLYFG